MNRQQVVIGNRVVGEAQPVYVIAEIGINHNGSLELAKRMIDGAALAGCDAVKFQKRTPELAVPREQWDQRRETPWGTMTYIDYKLKIEFGQREYEELDRHCRARGIDWFASCWDEEAVAFIERFDPPCHKVASAVLTDTELLRLMRRGGRPMIMSTGMSTIEEIDEAVAAVGRRDLCIAHTTSSYPCPVEDLNLRMLHSLMARYRECPIGYSGHETGLAPTWAAVALGAMFVERHITVDRAMWGTDQAASVELPGLMRMVAHVRDVERALGDGVKRVTAAEQAAARKLRRRPAAASAA